MSKDIQHTEFLVIDLEATCWEKNQMPSTMISEIIEIGYAILKVNGNQILSHGSIIVKPERSTISEFCTNLTTLTQEIVDRGVYFPEACRILTLELNSFGRPWASYGNYDIKMLKDQCERLELKYPMTPQHLNVKTMSTVLIGKRQGVGGTLTSLGLQFEGQQHRGGDDAFNIARILQEFTKRFKEV